MTGAAAHHNYDLVVIGGGPAGQAACLALDGRLARVAVIDEQLRPGGQILRQPPAAFSVSRWLAGSAYRGLKRQLAAFEALKGVDWLGGCSVLEARRDGDGWRLVCTQDGRTRRIRARRLLVAAGCYDMAVPLPGWILPGVMSAGAVQAFIKSQQLAPGRRIALAGSHPLQLLVAEQIMEAGAQVAVVAFPQTLTQAMSQVLSRPWTALVHAPRLLSVLAGVMRLVRQGVVIRFDDPPVRVIGEQAVTALELARTGEVACDAIAFCFGFLPQSDLPRAMGLSVEPGRCGGWAVRHDDWMRTSQSGVYAAGETVGVKGAEAAGAEGRIAGLAIALDEGLISEAQAGRAAGPVRRQRARALTFADLLDAVADPGDFRRIEQPPETIICRCEDVTLAMIDAAVRVAPAANAVKLATRCGMGPCQGRNCEHVLLSRLPAGEGGCEGFSARFPARPTLIADIIQR